MGDVFDTLTEPQTQTGDVFDSVATSPKAAGDLFDSLAPDPPPSATPATDQSLAQTAQIAEHSAAWKNNQARLSQEAQAAGMPSFSSGRDQLVDAISRSKQAGYDFPSFAGGVDPTGDRTVAIDQENLIKALKLQEAQSTDPAHKQAISRERAYWEKQLAGGMTAQQWTKQTGEPDPVIGMLEGGNIDLSNAKPIKNPDGAVSAVRSMGINVDGHEVLIPTVALDGSRVLSQQEAIDQYRKTGKHLGVFATPELANQWAQQLHEVQAARISGANNSAQVQQIFEQADAQRAIEQNAHGSQIAENAAGGVIDTAKGFVPHTVGEAVHLATPVATAFDEIGKGVGAIHDWIQGKPIPDIVKERFPESQMLAQVEQTPPGSRERFALGSNVIAQMLMAKGIAGGLARGGAIESAAPKVSPDEAAAGITQPAVQGGLGNQMAVAKGSAADVLAPSPEIRPTDRAGINPSPEARPVPEVSQAPVDSGLQEPISPTQPQAEQPVPKGGDITSAVEPIVSDEPHVSSIANKFVQERAAMGQVGEIMPGQGYSVTDLAQRGLRMSPEEVNQHVSDMMQGGGDPVLQAAAVRGEEARLSQRSNQLSRIAENNPVDMNAKLAADNAFKDLTDFHNGPVAQLKQNWANQGRAMQGEIPVDLGTFNGLREQWLRDTGKPPPVRVEAELRRTAKNVSDSVAAENGARSRLAQEIENTTSRRKLPTADEVRSNIRERMNLGPCNL